MAIKKYFIENDILKIAGEDAIKNTTRGGNEIYLNIFDLEKLSEKEESKGFLGPYSETLKYINNFNIFGNEIKLDNGGKIILNEGIVEDKNIVHLTHSQSITSRLKRKGFIVEKPEFLHFGPELINNGIVKLEDNLFETLQNNNKINENKINPYEGMKMKSYFNKNPELLDYLHKQGLGEYFELNNSFNRTFVNSLSKSGVNLITKALTNDVIKKGELIKKGLSKKEAEKKVVSIYQRLIEPYKKFEDNITEKKINFNLESIIDYTGDEYYNNQVLKIGSDYFQVKYTLIEHTNKDYKTGRYSIDEEIPATLELISKDIQKISVFPEFKPRNIEQIIAFQQLINPDIEMSILEGGSGSGKTVVAYAAALQSILISNKNQKPKYDGIILFKSNDIIGGANRELGFLPGSAYEKVKPFMKSFEDAHNLLGLNKGNKGIEFRELLANPTDEKDEFGLREKHGINGLKLPNNKVIEIEHLQFARGRTFENKYIFVDEAQNYSPYEIKQLIERVGIGCKLILVGDVSGNQMDNPNLNQNFNGLTYTTAINAYKHPRFSMIRLVTNYRSQSAEIMRNQRAPGN